MGNKNSGTVVRLCVPFLHLPIIFSKISCQICQISQKLLSLILKNYCQYKAPNGVLKTVSIFLQKRYWNLRLPRHITVATFCSNIISQRNIFDLSQRHQTKCQFWYVLFCFVHIGKRCQNEIIYYHISVISNHPILNF